jgi:hypothetical protein
MSAEAGGPKVGNVCAYLLVKVQSGTSASEVAQFVVTSCFEIDKALSPIIGQRGLAALFKRSLHLASAHQPWLSACQESFDLKTDLAELMATLSLQPPDVAAHGGGLFLEQFHQLLTALVGTSLTERLLRSVWATFLSGPPASDLSS